jgi:5-methylcytosine-specific restriction protein A
MPYRPHTPETPHLEFYSSDRWRRFRHMIRRQRPVCEDCNREPSKDIHHLEKVRDCPRRRLDPTNVLALCHRCHSIRTGRGE